MHKKLLALAAISLATSAHAQCGLVQLTTPPNFISNNGGAVGGMVYFTLDVLSPTGVSICGFELHTGINGPISGTIELHQSITDWNLLTATNNTAADWCTVACVAGSGNGSGTPSPVSVISGNNRLDLPMGQHLVAIGAGNFDHDYTNGNGANQVVGNGSLMINCGQGANTQYGTTLFAPRVANMTIDYDVPVVPVTLTPCGFQCLPASCSESGTGCGGTAATVAELFDGGNPWDLSDPTATPPTTSDTLYVGGSGAVQVLNVAGGSAIVPPAGPDLGLPDDGSSPLIPLGFNLGEFGLPCVDSISVQSNGCIWLGAVGSGDFTESLAELETQQARICAYWNDLRPLSGGGGGTIHVDQTATETLVTYNQVFIWGGTVPLTFQVSLTPGVITVRYDASSAFASSAVVGYHNGNNGSGVVSSDFSAGAGPVGPGGANLSLDCAASPVLGGSLDVELGNIPSGGIGAVLAIIGSSSPGVLQPSPPFAAGCETYIPASSPSLGLVLNANPCHRYPFKIGVPNNNVWLGLDFAAQGAALDVSGNQFLTSNVVDAEVGNFAGPGPLSVSSVAPPTGSQGSIITINGEGFATDPVDMCVFLGGQGASGRVISATPTQIQCEIGAVAAIQAGDVSVVRGQGQNLAASSFTLGTATYQVDNATLLFANAQANAGVAFALVAAAPATDGATYNAGTTSLDTTISGGVAGGTTVTVDLHLYCGGTKWVEVVFDATPNVARTAAQLAAELAAIINALYGPAATASAAGATLSVTKGGIVDGFGSIQR